VRVGGFGGAEGLAAWLRDHAVDALVDATHPFAERITAHAARAAASTGVPAVFLRRPGFPPAASDEQRVTVPTLAEAARTLAGLAPARVLLTTGRLGLAAFAGLDHHHFLVRSVEPPDPPLPARTEVLLARGPFTLEDEVTLLLRHDVRVLVTKDSGGPATAPKLVAARRLGVPVVLVGRPALPAGVTAVEDVAGAVERLGRLGVVRVP
jgi:precorrin-6A/cobalt-precorrin-6A reductase